VIGGTLSCVDMSASSSKQSSSTKKSTVKKWVFHFKNADQVYSMTVPDKYDEEKIYEKIFNNEFKIVLDEKAIFQPKGRRNIMSK